MHELTEENADTADLGADLDESYDKKYFHDAGDLSQRSEGVAGASATHHLQQTHELYYSAKIGEGGGVDHTFRTPRDRDIPMSSPDGASDRWPRGPCARCEVRGAKGDVRWQQLSFDHWPSQSKRKKHERT